MSSLEADVRTSLAPSWRLASATVRAHDAGMNSRTWEVRDGGRRWVAKAVRRDAHDRFVGGLRSAQLVDAAGIPAGAPEPTTDGASSVRLPTHTVALLRFVHGEPLTGRTDEDQRLIGSTLARAHRALRTANADADRFHWIDPQSSHLDLEPWIRPAVEGAIAAYDALPPDSLTWSLLHSDPAPEAFRFDVGTGVCGLIDWDSNVMGPLMYDVASAVMYVGGRERAEALVDAYMGEGVISASEFERSLEPMLRMRWAVQADYFARRIATNDLTGIAGPEENRQGLEDARRALVG